MRLDSLYARYRYIYGDKTEITDLIDRTVNLQREIDPEGVTSEVKTVDQVPAVIVTLPNCFEFEIALAEVIADTRADWGEVHIVAENDKIKGISIFVDSCDWRLWRVYPDRFELWKTGRNRKIDEAIRLCQSLRKVLALDEGIREIREISHIQIIPRRIFK